MDDEAEAAIAKVLSALADPVRRQVLDLIASTEEATATTIAVALPISRQAVTKHLAILEAAGLVTTHRRGRDVLYTINPAPIEQAATWLFRRAESWDARLLRLKRLAESS
jgi:DNA-binding transcriptional ArsR family regulator